jgi:hypothetical protein
VLLLGWDLLSQLKDQILLPHRSLSLLPSSSGTSRSHRVDLWNDCRASQNGPLNSNKTQSSQFSHQKQYPLKPEGQGGFLPIINSLKKKKQGLLLASPASAILLFLLSVRGQTNGGWLKTSSSLMKQQFPSTQLFPIPILY